MDSNFGLEDFSTYASARENQGVPIDKLRRRYDKAIEERKQEQLR